MEREAEVAKNARNGFHHGMVRGLVGMALAGLSRGRLAFNGRIPPAREQIRPFSARSVGVSLKEAERLARAARAGGCPLHDAFNDSARLAGY